VTGDGQGFSLARIAHHPENLVARVLRMAGSEGIAEKEAGRGLRRHREDVWQDGWVVVTAGVVKPGWDASFVHRR
jgi:hypothetical protein